MDLEMPVMGGLETVGLVRSFQAKAAQRPSVVIALSAHDDPQTMRQARASGFDRCEGKPITRDRMARVLDAVAAALEDAR
jgi:CheY-like chemotaxis protein